MGGDGAQTSAGSPLELEPDSPHPVVEDVPLTVVPLESELPELVRPLLDASPDDESTGPLVLEPVEEPEGAVEPEDTEEPEDDGAVDAEGVGPSSAQASVSDGASRTRGRDHKRGSRTLWWTAPVAVRSLRQRDFNRFVQTASGWVLAVRSIEARRSHILVVLRGAATRSKPGGRSPG
ncbi:MAG: hypothetical protein K0V04_18485 [Deltaproteobacteria bacterium]|nr:hypothetical protein [Deltaproteobacteria bacterium]